MAEYDGVINLAADDGVLTSAGGVLTSDGGVLNSDGGVLTSDGGVLTSDGGVLNSDGGVLNSDGGVLNSVGGVLNSDIGVLNSDFGVLNSDFGVLNSDFGVLNSVGADLNSDGADLNSVGADLNSDGADPTLNADLTPNVGILNSDGADLTPTADLAPKNADLAPEAKIGCVLAPAPHICGDSDVMEDEEADEVKDMNEEPDEDEEPGENQRLFKPQFGLLQIQGRLRSKEKFEFTGIISTSYSLRQSIFHRYYVGYIQDRTCRSHRHAKTLLRYFSPDDYHEAGISAVDFDKEGHHLIALTTAGCITIYKFDARVDRLIDDPDKLVLHRQQARSASQTSRAFNAVRWNRHSPSEVICLASGRDLALVYDVNNTKVPVATLASSDGSILSVITSAGSLIYGSNNSGTVRVWDRRMHPRHFALKIVNAVNTPISSLELDLGNQLLYGAGANDGHIHTWDLRAAGVVEDVDLNAVDLLGSTSRPLLSTLPNDQFLWEFGRISSISIDPSCHQQLCFLLRDGRSGIWNMHSRVVTHHFCPEASRSHLLVGGCWLPFSSLYAVGYSQDDIEGIAVLNYFPDSRSPSSLDRLWNNRVVPNYYLQTNRVVTSCTAHPVTGAIVAGTELFTLMSFSQGSE